MSYEIPGPSLSDTSGNNPSSPQLDLLIDEYGGEVESQFKKTSIMRQYVRVRPVRGTDTIVNSRVGRTQLQKLTPGVRPESAMTPFGKVALTVDTVIIARDTRSMLNDFQTHFDARMELAQDHGKEIGYFFDEAMTIMAIKGAGMAAPTLYNSDGTSATAAQQSIGAGKSTTLSNAGDELDPDRLADAIEGIIVSMEEEEIPTEELVVFVRPTSHRVLRNNNKLVSKDFSPSNGDYAAGTIATIAGARIEKFTRIPTAAISGHKLSNAANGNAFDVSATEAKAVAVIIHPKSLLAGETIPLQNDVFFSKEEKVWYIDSFLAFSVTVNRPDVCGRVLKA